MAKKIITYDDGRFVGLDVSTLAENTTPDAGDWLISQSAAGDLEKVDVGNLPGGGGGGDSLGTGFTSGGGSGTIPSGTIANAGEMNGATLNMLFQGVSFYQSFNDVFPCFGIESFSAIEGSPYSFAGFESDTPTVFKVFSGNFSPGAHSLMTVASDLIQLFSRILIYQTGGDGGINIQDGTFSVNDTRVNPSGLRYSGDYSEHIASDDRNIPDVGTVKAIARPYQYYDFLINQNGTDDPVPTIFENTIGEIVWTRTTEGTYLGTLSGVFINDKTWYTPKFSHDPISGKTIIIQPSESTNAIEVRTYLSGTLSDSVLVNFPIGIRIYP